MFREGPPVIRELFDEFIVSGQFFLEVRVRVHVNNHCQALIQNHFHCGIKITEVVFGNAVCLLAAKNRLWVNAQPRVVELHRFDQCDVLRRGPRFEVFLGIAFLVVDLREPLAQVDSIPQVGGASLCKTGVLGGLRHS